LLQFTPTVHYALEALTHLAGQPDGTLVPSHVMARERGLPERFLLKILMPLAKAGVVQSVKGPNGGYRLVRPAKAIRVLDVAQAVEPGFLAVAPDRGGGQLAPYLERLGNRIGGAARAILAGQTLADCLAADRKAWRKK
jgi:Rrf2 family transcriptional regulator, iron-sulfur cluster assembly transcription factor